MAKKTAWRRKQQRKTEEEKRRGDITDPDSRMAEQDEWILRRQKHNPRTRDTSRNKHPGREHEE